jgi:hypothetical protein
MEATVFVREVADGCWAAGIGIRAAPRKPARITRLSPHSRPHRN